MYVLANMMSLWIGDVTKGSCQLWLYQWLCMAWGQIRAMFIAAFRRLSIVFIENFPGRKIGQLRVSFVYQGIHFINVKTTYLINQLLLIMSIYISSCSRKNQLLFSSHKLVKLCTFIYFLRKKGQGMYFKMHVTLILNQTTLFYCNTTNMLFAVYK